MSGTYTSRTVREGFSRGPRLHNLQVEKPKEGKRTLGRLLRYFRQERKQAALMLGVSAIGVVLSVAGPALQSTVVNRMVEGSSAIAPLLGWMAAVYLLAGLAVLSQGYLGAQLSQRVVRRIRSDLFATIVHLPVSYLDSHSHGDLLSRMTNDADNISTMISTSLASFCSGILTLAAVAGMMLYFNVPLALLSLSVVVFCAIATTLMTKKLGHVFTSRQDLLGTLNGKVEEMIGGRHTVTAYNLQDEVTADFNAASDKLTRTGIIAEIIGGSMGPIHNVCNNLSFIIVAVVGAVFALHGWTTIGVISAFIVYSKQFARPVNDLAQLYGQLETALAGAERIFAVMDEPTEDKSGKRLTGPVHGIVEFQHVRFSYVPGKEIIHDFNLKIDAGKKIALVGATGSGKTTIINLLMRFYPVDGGRILLDGTDIRTIALDDLRGAVGIVLQDTVLFSDTLRNNLKYADADAGDEAMERAAAMANADQVARSLPEGYDTVLERSGASLSQGQRQLIAIGRAFLSRPAILILDEATSSVDTRTERQIQDAMVRLMAHRTSLIIAHRLSTIQDADTIIVMDHGDIVERGTHAELLARGGRYAALYLTQFSGKAI